MYARMGLSCILHILHILHFVYQSARKATKLECVIQRYISIYVNLTELDWTELK